jgi:phospholipase D1/2
MSVEGMRALVDSHAPYGPLIFMAMLVAGVFTHVPMMEILLIAVGGVLFGGFRAFVYGWAGSLVGATSTFLLVRYVGRDYVQRALSGRFVRLRALDERLARNGFWTVFALRLVLVLAPPLNWGLGLTRVGIQHYVAGTALGVVPGIAITVFFADSIANHPPGSGVLSPRTALGAVLIIAAVAAAGTARRLLGRGEATPPV